MSQRSESNLSSRRMRSSTSPAGASVRIGTNRRSPRPSDRKSTRLNSSHLVISYAVFCLKKTKERFECTLQLPLDSPSLFPRLLKNDSAKSDDLARQSLASRGANKKD